jgi:DHA1 family tetracycline resistance protein-like MFS transporter
MTQSEVGNLFAYAGLWIAVSQGVLAGIIAKKVSAIKVVPIASIFLALTITLLVFPTNYTHMLFIIPFIAVFNGLVVPNITTIISDSADKDSQGEVMGINQSLLSLTQIIPPIIDGFLYSISVDLPIISASLLIVGAWAYFHFKFNKKQKAFAIDKII